MPYDKIDQLYDALKADGAVSKDRKNFRNVMLAPGKDGYQNRKQLFDALKADGAVDSNSYEEFAQRLGLHAVKPAGQKAPHAGTPMTAAEREEFAQGAQGIMQQAQGAEHRARNAADYAKGNTGLHVKPVAIGRNKKVVERTAFNPTTGKMGKTYLTETGSEHENRGTADLEQNAVDDYEERVLHPVESELNNAYAERDRLAKMASERGETLDNAMPAVAFGAGQAMTSGSIHRMSDEEYRQWQAATAANNERIKTLEAQRDKDKAGFWRGFADSTTDPNTWLFGIPGLADTATLYATAQKVKKGQPLTESEKAMLDNTIANQQAHGKYDGERGFLYRAGQISAQALPFVAEFLTTGGYSGIANVGAKFGNKAAAKYGTNAASKWLLKNTGVLAGDVAAGWAMANTTGAAKTATDVLNRKMGQVSVDKNENYKFEGDKGLGQSLWEGEAAQTLEYYTERLGEHLQIGNWLAKGAEKLGLSKLSKAINYMSTNKWLEKGGVQDYPSEVFEEEANIVLNAMLVGDNSISDLWDGKTQADIWGGMALSVGMMNVPKYAGTGYQTAQYYRYKHATDKAAKVASYQMDTEKWKSLQADIDGATNDNMADIVSGIMSDIELQPEEKKAAADYAYNLLKMRGYNMGLMNAAKDEADSGEPADHSADESFNQGYNAEGAALTDAKTAYELQQQKIAEKYGEDAAAYADDNPVGYLHQLKEQGADEEVQGDFLAYINAKSAFDGVIQRAQDDLDDRITESDAMIDSRMHRQDGAIHPATMKYKDRKVYVVSGNVVMSDDGTMVDNTQSDDTLIIRDAETGELEFSDPASILSVDETIDPEEEKAAAAEAITQTFGKERADQIDGVLPMLQGDTYNIVDDEGKPHTVQVVQNNGDGSLAVMLDGAQEAVPMTAEQLQAWADNANVQRVRQQEEEAATASQSAEPEAETGNGRPTYSINDEITLRGEDGLPVRGSVGAEENADGLIEVYTESPIKGKKVNMFTRDELDGMLLQHNGEDVNAGMGVAGDAGAVERPQEDAQESAPENVGKSALQDGATAEPMPMIGEGEDAEPDFSRVDPARAHTYIYNEAGLNREEGNEFVAANLKEAQKALDKAKKGEPKMGTSIAKYRKEQAAYGQIVGEAQKVVDYWNGVKAEQDKIVAEESRVRAEQQAEETRKAVEAERQRKEAEVQKAAEQAEVGTHNVTPALKEKWDAARKIEGATNEIVLPNGEKVAGRYVLVESGAASPSHNATNEFTKTEGFPIDENGQSVNDRDYERDKDAQRITRDIASDYDSRAMQSPVVVSRDGVVLSGNGRTMAGELATANNTDGAYIEHLQKYPQQYGFTPEQVQGMEHPRVLFVPDADMPYTAETFAKYNQQEMKGQSKTEHAVKLGKVVDDATFNRIIRLMNQYDTLGDFYADSKATHDAIGELQTAGVVAPAQVAEMFDGDGISAQGREMLENMLIGKAFESNPDAVRQITAFKSMRQSVITALAEISNNKALGDGYSLEKELADAIALVYNARNDKYKAGERVSEYARQGNLFQLDDGATVADFTNATTMMLADVLNDNRSTQLKKILAVYNHNAADSAAGQMDMFSGGVLTKRDILNEVKQLINYGTEQQQTEAIGQAVERRKAESIQQDGDTRGSGEKEPAYRLSDEVDENGRQFVLTSEGKLEFGELGAETGLPPAPIMLSEGIITNPKTNDGYGLVHIEARHGEQIRNAGYSSVLDFIEEVAKHYEVIKEGKNRNGNQTYMLQLTDKHNNTLMVEMSADGNYWNINTAGIFKTSYGKNRKEVYNRHTTAKQPAGTVGVSQDSEQDGTQKSSSMNTPSTSSASKDSKSSEIKQKYEDIFAKAERIARESEVKRKITEAEKEADVNPTEGQKEAGNYKKGHVTVDGLDVTIEQPKGSVRRGKDADGKEWESEMHNTYGYIKGTEGVDGDHIDIFLSDNPASGHVFVVDQVNPKTGEFDEHKVMYGFDSAEEAKQAYLSNYKKGWKGLGDITEVTKEEFKKWIDSSKRKTKPFAEYAAVKTQSANRVENKSSKDLSKSEKDVSLQSKSSEYENSRRNSQGTGRNRPKKLGENDAIGLRLESAGRESEKANGGSLGERIERERAAAEKFAAEHGALMSIDDLFSLGDIGPSGTESDTYFSRDGYVYKMNNLMHNPLVSDYLKRLSFHNKIFTNTPYELVGFVKSGKSLYPVVRQESVDFDRQGTKEEISSYMQSLGFVDDGDGVFHDGNYIIKDVKPKNVFVGKDGQIYVVDAEISEKANSPEVKQKKEDEVSEIPAMTEAEYLASKGLGSPMSDYMLDKMRIPHGETARQMAKRKQEAERAMEEHAAQKEAARKEYREKIANGELREPTKEEAEQKRIDALVKTANGHDDNPSVQAARRVLDKRGIEWKKNEDIFTRAERIAQDVANKKDLEKREPTKAGKIPQEEKEDLLSQKEYVDNGMSSALEQTQYKTLEEWEDKDTEDYARKYDDFLADYTNYINDFANGEKLQALYDKSSVKVQKEIRRHIEDAGLDYHDILDTSPGRIRIQDRLTKKMKYAKGEFSDGTIVAGEVVSQTPTSLVINSRGRKYTIKAGSVLEQSDEPIASGGILFRGGEQEYTEEEREVIANAKADGSYMKAPNGKSTKLTEHQWVQVRTKAFKEWFGDWEKAARIEKLRKSKAVKITGEEIVPSDDLKQYKKNALEYGKKLRGEYTNEDTGESIALTGGNSRGGIREILQHDYKDTEHLQSIAAIPQIIEKSIFIDDIPNEDVEKYSGVKSFRYYVCGLKIGNNDYTVKAVVAVQNNGERYYDHKLSSIEKGKLLSIIPTIQKAGIENNLPPSIGKDKRLFSILQTNSSKVLDENGEPMVVYHGTLANGLHQFNKDFIGSRYSYDEKGFFFISNENIAKDYATSEFDANRKGEVIDAYLSLKNPLIVDSAWCRKNGLGYRVFEDNDVIEFWDNYQILLIEESEDKDGVVITDGKTTMAVAFEPDQIKSATENNGEFDAGNDDIRFRKTEQAGYTDKQREEYDLRQRRRIQDAARETASKLGIGDRVTMMETADGLTGRRAKAKGWFDTETGKIVVVLGNHRNREDVMQTILHEGVAHYGLRQLFGPHFGTFLDNVLLNADEDVRRAIVEMAAKYGWDFRTATEEYLAGLAENTDFERAMDRGWFNRIKDLFLKMLHKIGFEGFTGVDLSDNELRYILWRSYENLTEPGRYRSILGEAADVDMQSRLKVGNYQVQQTGDGDLAAEPAPIGNGVFGPIYDQFRGKAKEAISFLTRKKAGEAVGALYHKDIGDIDLVWGNGKAGLAHILSKHPNVLDGIQDFINEMEVVQSSENRIVIESDSHRAVISKMLGQEKTPQWLLTAYAKKNATGGSSDIDPEPNQGKQNGTAPLQGNSSSAKIGNVLESSKEPDEKVLFRDGEEREDYDAGHMTFEESITNGLVQLSKKNKEKVGLRVDAMRSLKGNLSTLRRAMAAQRAYDKSTVDQIVRLAQMAMDLGAVDTMTRTEVKRLMSLVKNAAGKENITKQATAVVDMLIHHQLNEYHQLLTKQLNVKGSKLNHSGVEIQAGLDVDGQRMVKAVKDGMGLDEVRLNGRIEDILDRMGNDDKALAANASVEYQGLLIAKQYLDGIKKSKIEEKELRNDIKTAKEDLDAGKLERVAYREFVHSTENAIRQNRFERMAAYEEIITSLGDGVRLSIQKAKEFREREQNRVREIQHNANSDLQGMPASEHVKLNWVQNAANWSFIRFFMKPLATFDQMLRYFGRKSANGQGYLWNRFMGNYNSATDKEWRNLNVAHKILDTKASEVFGKGIRWSDLFAIERKMPKMAVEFWDAGEKRQHDLTQGNMLYIYMVDKMSDGRMKLRRMGITEADVEAIKEKLDPRFITLADWVQDVFFKDKRNEYNAVHERLFGASMAAIENYFPLVINSRSRGQEEEIGEPNRGESKPATVTGAIIKRTRNATALDVTGADAFDVVLGHLQQMEHWAAFAEMNHDINTLLSYKRFRNRVLNMSSVRFGSGKVLWKNFEDTCAIAAGVYRPMVDINSIDTTVVNLAKGVTAAKISFRLYTALKQLLSYPAYLSEANIKELFKSTNPVGAVKAWNWALDELPGFAERWQSRQAGDSRLKESDADWRFWHNKIVETAGRWGMSPNAFIDGLTVAMGAKAIYETKKKRFIKDGYTEELAKKKALFQASVSYNETQQSSQNAYLNAVQLDRTVASVALTVFRNSSMGYQRRMMWALKNLQRKMKKGYRKESIEFMTKQMVRDGLTEKQAQRAAERAYNHSWYEDIANVAIFGFVMQFAWNLGPYLPYLLMGDGDDDKKDMMVDAALHALAGGVEGLSAGSTLSELYNLRRKGNKFSDYNFNLLPVMSDIQTTMRHFDHDEVQGWNDIANILIQSGIGVNPQTLTDAFVAIMDAAQGNPKISQECALLVMRVMQVPQSQLDKLYIDELGLTARDAKKLDINELAKRYAAYKLMKKAPLGMFFYQDDEREKQLDKYIKRFDKQVSEHISKLDEHVLTRDFDNATNTHEKSLLGKEIARRQGMKDTYGGKQQTKHGEIYNRLRNSTDIKEDLAISGAIQQAKDLGDLDLAKDIEAAKKELTETKKDLGYGEDSAVMQDFREMRKQILDEFGIMPEQSTEQ